MAKRTKEERLAELLAEVESKKIDELKRTNERLLRQIERLKDRNADLKESVYRAITDGINTLSLPKLKPPSKKKSQKAHHFQ